MGLLDGDAYVSVMDPAYKPVDQRRAAMAGLLRGLLDVSPVGLLDVAKTAGAAFGNPGLARAPNPTDYAAGLLGLQRPQATAFSPSENAQRAYDFGNAVAPVAASAGGLMANALRGAPLSQVNSGAAGARRQVASPGKHLSLDDLAAANRGLDWSRESDGSFFVRALEAADAKSNSNIAWARFSKNGELVDHGKDWVTAPSEAALKKASQTAAELANYWASNVVEPYYFRFGGLPKNGLSKNSITGGLEKGVSVYEAAPDVFGRHVVNRDLNVPFLGQALMLERPAYRVSGKLAGVGSDGEPVLSAAKILGEIKGNQLLDLIFGRE